MTPFKATEAPATGIRSETIIRHPGIMVVRLDLPSGGELPFHVVASHVVIVAVSGSGHVTIENETIALKPGKVVELMPGEKHDIRADSALQIVLIKTSMSDAEARVDALIDNQEMQNYARVRTPAAPTLSHRRTSP
jgi:quercetin dioxygenase-like cupin family protein